jgi:hypothetical protein
MLIVSKSVLTLGLVVSSVSICYGCITKAMVNVFGLRELSKITIKKRNKREFMITLWLV